MLYSRSSCHQQLNMRTESLLKDLSSFVHSNRSTVIMLAGTIVFLLFPQIYTFGAGFSAQEGATQVIPTFYLAQNSADALDCPLLPGCPSGPSVPLPPVLPNSLETRKQVPAIDGNKLSEGTGKYANMVLIPAGPFEMGSEGKEGGPDERPVHKVFVKDFYLAREVVTVQMYCEFLNTEGEHTSDGLPRVKLDSPNCPVAKERNRFQPKEGWADKPMVFVSWYGASDYAQWAGGRLPTAAEWEKAAGLTVSRSPENNLPGMEPLSPNHARMSLNRVVSVTGMVGNVWEWCSDWYSRNYYQESPKENPTGPPLGQEKEIRGGSYCSPQASHSIQNRHKAAPRGHFRTVGFRIVKD